MYIILEKYHENIKKANVFFKKEGCKTVFLFGSMVTDRIHAILNTSGFNFCHCLK